jgi:cell wall-associated NlpC family hydrolase
MRRGVWLLVLGLLLAAAGAASAYGAGGGTTPVETTLDTTTSEATTPTPTTPTTTTTTTTVATTTATTTTAPSSTTTATTTTPSVPKSYASLPASYLSNGCVGAGAAAIAEPGRRVLTLGTLGTPASTRGPSAYPVKAPIVRFVSSSASGSSCSDAHITLGSVSLFGGVITARTVTATSGRGTVDGFEIYGSPVGLRAGNTVPVGGWGEVSLEKRVGRLIAPLVVQLVAAHDGLPAGTTVAVGFAASAQDVQKVKTGAAGSQKQANKAGKARKQKAATRLLDYPVSASPFAKDGGFTAAAEKNPVVSVAMRYLGIPYQWGGATPKTGFDCSGLVQYVFAQFGVPLIHYAASQWHTPDGVWVSPHHLKAGDLVFFVGSDGTRKEPGHVGIYIADGYFIDAPHTGSFVRVDSLDDRKFAKQYVGARRIVGPSADARELLHEANPRSDTAVVGVPSSFASGHLTDSLGVDGSSVSPLPLAIDVPTAEHIAAGGSDMGLLVGGPLGALALLVAAAGGAFFVRKRRREDLPEAPLH